jgi:hypothetical protein
VSNIAHLFSMRTNGLSLKPCDGSRQAGLYMAAALPAEYFLQPCPAAEDLFHALLARSMDNREIRRLHAQPEHARLYLGKR